MPGNKVSWESDGCLGVSTDKWRQSSLTEMLISNKSYSTSPTILSLWMVTWENNLLNKRINILVKRKVGTIDGIASLKEKMKLVQFRLLNK